MAITTHGGTTDAADKTGGVVPIVSSELVRREDEKPTAHLKYQNGVLMQLWTWTDARWDKQFQCWQHFAMKEWRRVNDSSA